ncbi:hypothetical protein BGZ46_007212 [Entomortierella lignicola]|nr:hypothetical protein BGZ46_007212 [Entomortierella lignicola]
MANVASPSVSSNYVSGESNYPEPKTQSTQKVMASPSTAAPIEPSQSSHSQFERHIPSYEQWRKQVLDKKKPAEANERKQRKRKPYQESAVDVAIGSEEEIGFVFPNIESEVSNSKNSDERFQRVSDPLGDGPDLKQELSSEKEWIKAEYTKDPKDRFNHASGTCAASVVKASKDATSITAILNEGKDHYMLNKCATKEKFFVVELCEEILVDTFILGNYEFFSSTFKEFIVSVNRYPPRDDGWSILGYFQARNTRDAQVFRPAVPQLATYIRFDFVTHYGNEYYCPVTLLRVYGATALEQLKQEEEEEKRVAEEEKRLAELEKARQAAAEAEDAEEIDSIEVEKPNTNVRKGNQADDTAPTVSDDENQEGHSKITDTSEVQSELSQPSSHGDPKLIKDGTMGNAGSTPQGLELEDLHKDSSSSEFEAPSPFEHTGAGSPSPISQDQGSHPIDGEEGNHSDESIPTQSTPLETILVSFEETIITTTDHGIPETLPPRASTSPASIHDDGDWANEDLGMITLSPKVKPTQPPKPPSPPKPVSGGVGTVPSGTLPAADTSSHPTPSPQHSSQESVYKNIVNRLKVLELNSSLSYQYLEEQSILFNDILESSEQKINQLVSHLNEATRRLETLGRKYDQLAYSYRAHVEVDGEKRRQEFNNLSTQVHLLVSQVVFQRQLFVICIIIIISIIASIAITRSTTMHYAIQQSPLGAKLRAISGNKYGGRLSDIASTVRIGSVEGLSQFDQSTLLLHHPNGGAKLTPPMSPISPLTPNPNHGSESTLLENHELPGEGSSRSDLGTSIQNGDFVENDHYSGKDQLSLSRPELTPLVNKAETPGLKLVTNSHTDSFQVSRTPFPTPKSSYGSSRIFLHPSHGNSSQQPGYQNDNRRPDSPVFQGPSGIHDEGHLSDADVAYMSRDMDVGRKGFINIGSMPISPAMKRISSGYSSHVHHPMATAGSRPSSSLRMDTTALLTGSTRSEAFDNTDTTHQSSEELTPISFPEGELNPDDENRREIQTNHDKSTEVTDIHHTDLEEDVGFVSDSVLDSASENLTGTKTRLKLPSGTQDRRDREAEYGETTPRRGSGDESDLLHYETSDTRSRSTNRDPDLEHIEDVEAMKDNTRLSRESSLKSRRRSSHNILRTLDYVNDDASYKSRSENAIFGLGLGLEGVGPDIPRSLQEDLVGSERWNTEYNAQVDEESAVPQTQAYVDKHKNNRKPSWPDDQTVPKRRVSNGRRESGDVGVKEGLIRETEQDGDDELSPQVPQKSVH